VIDFLLFYPVVWFFERHRPGVDGWNIAFCIAIPAIISLLVIGGFAFAGKSEIAPFINTVLFPIIMGLCLWKIVGLPGKRAIIYSGGYLLFWFFIGIILAIFGVGNAS
jgi:hypothetical protein